MKKYKIPVYEPYSSDILYYEDSYISENGLMIINILFHVGLYFVIKYSL
jgi:hypothetical protein